MELADDPRRLGGGRRLALLLVLAAVVVYAGWSLRVPDAPPRRPLVVEPAAKIDAPCLDEDKRSFFNAHWSDVRTSIRDDVREHLGWRRLRMAHYALGYRTQPILTAAERCSSAALLDDLIQLYDLPRRNLSAPRSEYHFKFYEPRPSPELSFYARRPIDPPARMWLSMRSDKAYHNDGRVRRIDVQVEDFSSVARFLAVVSQVLGIIARTPQSRKTPRQEQFFAHFWPIVVQEHLLRWGVRGDGEFQRKLDCGGANYNIVDYAAALRDNALGKDARTKRVCNRIDPALIFSATAAVEVLAANRVAPERAPLSADDRAALQRMVAGLFELFRSRIEATRLTDFAGRPAEGLVVETGSWADHPEFACAGSATDQYPAGDDSESASCIASPDSAIDMLRAADWAWFMMRVHQHRAVLPELGGADWAPAFARQIAYAVYDRGADGPRFANYIDGHNGWYRVAYPGLAGTGICPWCRSDIVPDQGLFVLAVHDAGLERVAADVWATISAAYVAGGPNEPTARRHLARWFGVQRWPGDDRPERRPIGRSLASVNPTPIEAILRTAASMARAPER